MSGCFLASLTTSCSTGANGKVSLTSHQSVHPRDAYPYEGSGTFQQTSQLSIDVRTVSSSTIFASVAILSRATAQVLPLLVETRPQDGWKAAEDVLKRFNSMAATLELHWSRSPLAMVDTEDDIGLFLCHRPPLACLKAPQLLILKKLRKLFGMSLKHSSLRLLWYPKPLSLPWSTLPIPFPRLSNRLLPSLFR
jgi:hypothetical protein